MHEAAFHSHNIFLTLTYDNDHLPAELVPKHLRNFIRAVRREVAGGDSQLLHGHQLRYIAAGEYGGKTQRPHYHLCAFGLGTKDEYDYKTDYKLSPALNDIWGKGQVLHATLTHANAAYCAAYTRKGDPSIPLCDADGVVLHPPFLRVSNRPGIGSMHATVYASDLVGGSCWANGQNARVPRYYQKLLKKHAPDRHEELQHNTYLRASRLDARHRSTAGRLAKEVVAVQRSQQKGRAL